MLLRREQAVGPGGDCGVAECPLGGGGLVARELCGTMGSGARGGVGWPGWGVLTGLSVRALHCLWAVTCSSLRRRSAPRSQEPSLFGPRRYASRGGWARLVDPEGQPRGGSSAQ